MAKSILVAYATRYGSTREVADAIAETLRGHGFDVDCKPARDVGRLAGYDGVVLGGALYVFKWHKDARRFLSRHRDALADLPCRALRHGAYGGQ